MIDISLDHATWPMRGFQEDWLEYKGWDKEFYALDLTKNEQAIYAIQKWLTNEKDENWPEVGTFQIKEACRYCLTAGLPFGNVWLPGISGIGTGFGQPNGVGDMARWLKLSTQFHLLLWSELFPDDPYQPADLSQYRQRVDQNFVNFPHMPETWGLPEYKPW